MDHYLRGGRGEERAGGEEIRLEEEREGSWEKRENEREERRKSEQRGREGRGRMGAEKSPIWWEQRFSAQLNQ